MSEIATEDDDNEDSSNKNLDNDRVQEDEDESADQTNKPNRDFNKNNSEKKSIITHSF